MTTHLPQRHVSALRPLVAWAGTLAVTLGALFGASSAMAVPPPAGVQIKNKAIMTYTDVNGLAISTNSNEVQTVVQAVGAFTLDGFSAPSTTVQNTKTGAGGTTVYAAHVITNTGNDVDGFTITLAPTTPGSGTFTKVEVFADANSDGLPDSTTPLCSSTGTPTCVTGTTHNIAGNGGTFPFVVAYTIPAGATTAVPFASELVTATPLKTALYTAPNTSASDVDTVNVTIIEAFSATKSIGAPTVLAPGNRVWPTANTSGPKSNTAGPNPPECGITFPVTQSTTCDYTVYTINYKNTGAVGGDFYVSDVLPAGFTFVTGSAVWSGASGVALTEAAGGDSTGINFQQSLQTLSALVSGVGPNVSGTLSFVVLVNSKAVVGQSTTTNTATFEPLTSTKTTGTGSASTNPAPFTVTATFGVVLGSATGTVADSADTTRGTPNATAFDLNTQASATAGSSVNFTQILFNTGDAGDTFNLKVSTTTFPTGTTFAFYAADGSTPLLDTNGDGIPDTGSVAGVTSASATPPGVITSKTFVVKANIPASAAPNTGPFTAVVVATSVGDSTKFDASRDNLTTVTGILVDLTNSMNGNGISGSVDNGDVGQGPSPSPTTTRITSAGTGAVFNLFVKNNDSSTQVYTLSSSNTTSFPGSLPAGWIVRFVTAGTGGCAAPAASTITQLSVPAGVQGSYDACVTPPANAPTKVITNVYFRVTSTTNAFAVDTKTDAVNVDSAPLTFSATLTPANNGSVAPAGTVTYAHTLNATGGQSCGTYTLSVTGNTAGGWGYSLFIDVNGDGQIDGKDTPVNPNPPGTLTINPALLLGVPQKILVKVFAPGGATPGAQDVATVTATFAAANGGTCAPASNTDTSTVVTGLMRGDKTQAIDAACDGTPDTPFTANQITAKPGQCVFYRVIAVNQGASPVTNMTINDVAPNYTHLAGAKQLAPAAACVAGAGITGTTPPTFVATGDAVKCGVAETVMPGGTLTLTFAVKIDQ